MFNTSSFRIADAGIDPKAVVRSARDLSLPDPGEVLRRVDVPVHVDAAIEAASDAARGVIERLPGQRRSTSAGSRSWWRCRRRRPRSGRRRDLADSSTQRPASQHVIASRTGSSTGNALDRAANEGMSIVPGKDAALSHSNGEVRELSAVGDLV